MRDRTTRYLAAVLATWAAAAGDTLALSAEREGSENATVIEVGDIVGAEYEPRTNALYLYATEPTPQSAITLYMDDVAKMALGVLCCGDFAFSLEFERTGLSPFRIVDVIEPSRFASRLRQARDPLVRYLQAENPDTFRVLGDQRSSRDRIAESLVLMLNRARKDRRLYRQDRFAHVGLTYDTGQMLQTPATKDPARLNRWLLEDAFAGEVTPEFGSAMQIRYLPFEAERRLKAIFADSTIEATLLRADLVLKNLAHGMEIPRDLDLAPPEVFLCAGELEAWTAAGRTLDTYPVNPYVTYFQLESNYRFAPFTSLGIWFDSPKVTVSGESRQAGLGVPPCVRNFVTDLTRRMNQLMTHVELGHDFRRLRALLLLCRTIGWARSIFAPIDQEELESLPFRRVEMPAVRARELPLVLRDPAPGSEVRRFLIRGGVFLSGDQPVPAVPSSELRRIAGLGGSPDGRATAARPMTGRGFRVRPGTWDQRRLLQIDVTDILGMRRAS